MASKKGGAPGPAPILAIAGLPRATAVAASGTVNNGKNRWRAIASPFPDNDAAIYEGPALADLLRLVCAFARDRAKDRVGIPVPSRLLLAYVRSPDSDRLWEGFGHAAWPIAFREVDAPADLRHWRHNIDVVNQRVAEVLQRAEGAGVEDLRLRLEARRTDDVLLLPARNFHISEDDRLVTGFRSFMTGAATADEVEAGITIERFAFSRLPTFYKETGGTNKRFAKDARGLVFARSNRGQHGAHHADLPKDAELPVLRRSLEGRFRFGTPIVPEGFQHDVQWEKDRPLKAVKFDCAQGGPVQVSASHANVYPNDVVKWRGKG
jgi:hypothetical protein